ncbi:ROK family protein [Deinococcus psychrotolerans]|uniref:ROK family protein n=1 Tax=Deinococcus psychrotolerans TaxID=2489213 RepID=UPI0024058E09|nr:ROK family protein [Deinococcus psychrotolerans]
MSEPAAQVLAVDIGGTTTRVALVEGLSLHSRREMPTQAHDGPERLLQRLGQLIAEVQPQPETVAVACTGRVHDGCVSAINTATMPGWLNIPLQATLTQTLKAPVAVINDARAATLGEWHARGAPASENFMFVTVSTGIGSGVILGGHLNDPPGGRDVGMGFTRGLNGAPLEYASSGSGLKSVAHWAGYSSVAALMDAAEAGNDRAQAALRAPLTVLADRIWDAHCLLGLHTICLGGSVGLRPFTGEVLGQVLSGANGPALQPAKLGADAGLIGAAVFVQQQERRV